MTAAGVDLGDRNVWDDRVLIDSWNGALEEYKKYHSIKSRGKRLEEVLTEEELRELREEDEDLLEEQQDQTYFGGHDPNTEIENMNIAEGEKVDGVSHPTQGTQQEPAAPRHEERFRGSEPSAPLHDAGPGASIMPQAILGTVQNENTKNLMMAWYYAGYYTGLHEGQQKAAGASSANTA